MADLRWKRVGKGSGPGNVLNGRWHVRGHQRYWAIDDLNLGVRHPARVDCYFGSMKEARAEAERLAREEDYGR